MSQLIKYTYNGQNIEFDVSTDSVMVNATEMAKIYGKQVAAFMRNEQTKRFIKACLKSENPHLLEVETKDDLVDSTQKSGTWMHSIIALKFAAWLDPHFEVWVYSTVKQILFGEYYRLQKELKASARRKIRIEELEAELSENETFRELEDLKTEERRSAYKRGKVIKNQLKLFEQRVD